MNILLIGYGAIGCYVARNLASSDPSINIGWILCREGRNEAASQALGPGVKPVNSVDEVAQPIDLAIECGGHAALGQHGPGLLARGIDVITVSNGALADHELAVRLAEAARQGDAALELVSGAIGAIDAIAAARTGTISKLVYRGRKPPASWKGSPAEQVLDLDNLEKQACHFSGTAREAALRYPKNANVAATVALAGSGLDNTQVELIADPEASGNIHEIELAGDFGEMNFSINGNPLPGNPKSSALTAMSVVAAVRRRFAHIKV
jgi:aspartate dehydrogenase